MKGVYGKQGYVFQISERDGRPVTSNMVRLKVAACGLCGTDLHFLRDLQEWTPLGHEISATVVQVGENVTKVAVGDTVICEDVSMCGTCFACKSGKPWLCRDGYTLDGQPGMSDELIVHENMLNKYSGIDSVTATLVEPLAVAIRSVAMIDVGVMSSVAVYGMGTIGLLTAGYLKLLGARRVVMIAAHRGSNRNKAAEDAAASMGITEFYYTEDADYKEQAVRDGMFDFAVVAAPPKLAGEALDIVGYGGTVLMVGVSFTDRDAYCDLNVSDMVFSKKQLITSIAEPAAHFPTAIELIRSGRLNVSKMVTNVIKMENIDEIRALYTKDSPVIKTVVICE